ncbi:GRIP and coiled-coil domain-containing protein 2 isoform X3 [Chiroxiphia lanceolata]|uniref:GRIP and coiled-coil domain-containing protein 2 isoform X3 n=1 Tax=Chiroxiphia lanceolata TaxID=296741 RepID=UPI0013CEFCB3|nr:GRIP and coiled-coil domain-containing protein 2 isoform X3 [Chiroxiphia lanceolata]
MTEAEAGRGGCSGAGSGCGAATCQPLPPAGPAMEVQDAGQEMVASSGTPGSGKSKLDTLPKEDLIKFAKKQMMLIQKVKSRCTELEKEIEELRSKAATAGADDIIQALTERLDVVLLEKAESQQQCIALRKENIQIKQEGEAAVAKTEELQKILEQSSIDALEEIKALKCELANAQCKHNEDLKKLKMELDEQVKKQMELMEQVERHSDSQKEVTRLQDDVQRIKSTYEEQILCLSKQLETVNEDKTKEVTSLQETIKNNSQCYHNEIKNLNEELKKLKIAHQEEVSELMHQIEISSKENEEKQNQINELQHNLAEKNAKDEVHCHTDQREYDLEQLREVLNKNVEDKMDIADTPEEPYIEAKMEAKVRYLEHSLEELQSQHSILKDELTYMSNVKLKLEEEIHRIKDEYFHEREDLDFKINELQLTKEDYCCVIEKLKLELKAARQHYEADVEEHKLEIQTLKEQHKTEISELNETLLSSSEKEKMVLVFEIQELREQLEKLTQEKEEAVSNYNSLRETMETLQAELGESAGKISQEFESMKQQQASDVSQLQQKLRAAFNERDVLLETVNRLQNEIEKKPSNQLEVEELKCKIVSLQEDNDAIRSSINQKEITVKELEEKIVALTDQNKDILNDVKCLGEERETLQERCKQEQVKIQELQQEVDVANQNNNDLTKKVEELTEKLNEALTTKTENAQMLEQLEKQIESLVHDREQLSSEVYTLHEENKKIIQEKGELSEELGKITSEKDGWLVLKEQSENLEKKLQMMTAEKDHVSTLLENEQRHTSLVRTQLYHLVEKVGSNISDSNEEYDSLNLLKIANEYLSKIKEKQCLALQNEEEVINLQREVERLEEEHAAQYREHRSLIQDFEKEKALLREELEGVLSEKEALQHDIQELKNASEKTRIENQDLLANIEEITQKLAFYESPIQEQEKGSEKKDDLSCILEQKETELRNVKDELSSLKNLMETMTEKTDQQSSVAELQEKIGRLEKESAEKGEKLNKIKVVAVKAKKELDASRKEMQALNEELELVRSEKDQLSASMKDVIQGAESYKNLLMEYDKQGEQLDSEKGRANNLERQIDDLTRQLQVSSQQHDQLRSANEDLLARVETLQNNAKLLETQILEMQRAKAKADKELEAERLLREQKTKEHSGALREMEELQMQLQKEKKHLQKTMLELELARKDAQKSTLMDMEIADYERLVKELNQKITDKDSRIEDLEQETSIQKQKQETLQEEIKFLQSTMQQDEERNAKIKQLLVKTKKELADSKQAENDHLMLQESLKGELEATQQQVEAYKIQVAVLTSEKHKVQEQLRTSSEQHQRMMSACQQKIATLQEECRAAQAEQASVTSEFESYKVRVHNVLKQQKNKSAARTESEGAKQEREQLEMVIDELKVKLQDAQHNSQMNASELQALQSEHDTLLERHNKMLQETVAKEAELREKLCTIQSENMVMKTEHAQMLSQLTAQNEALRNNFRDQVRNLQEEHRKTVETLQQQLSRVEAQLFQLKSEPSTRETFSGDSAVCCISPQIPSPAVSNPGTKNLRERRNTDLPVLDVHTVAREEGEGMETTDTESVSSASTYVQSLEQLLNSSEAKPEPSQWQAELSKDELIQKLNTTAKSADHLNELLRESEATNAILMEQIKLLKNEIRRLERNQEREKSVANLEYLKNVLLQFIFLKSGSEKERLLPVIDTMLQLSPEEKGKLVAIAQGEEESTSRPSGWASYLHSWSGLR